MVDPAMTRTVQMENAVFLCHCVLYSAATWLSMLENVYGRARKCSNGAVQQVLSDSHIPCARSFFGRAHRVFFAALQLIRERRNCSGRF